MSDYTVLRPLSRRGRDILVARQSDGWSVRWGTLSFRLSDDFIHEIMTDFFVDPSQWYPLGADMVSPMADGLGRFIQTRSRAFSSRHATAVAPILAHAGLVEWRGSKPIWLRRRRPGAGQT